MPYRLFLFISILLMGSGCRTQKSIQTFIQVPEHESIVDLLTPDTVDIEIHKINEIPVIEAIIPTFLGNEKRNYYGNLAPERLNTLWKLPLGTGNTRVGGKILTWSGAGWTGQPLYIKENGKPYLIQGSYDHHLRKIDAQTGKVVWKYKFDDVIKGTGSIWIDKSKSNPSEAVYIFQGSRMGTNRSFTEKVIPSYRAIDYFSGKEQWRLNSELTLCYSRDVDASGLMIGDTLIIDLENGWFTLLDPKRETAQIKEGIIQPITLSKHLLYTERDVRAHNRNVVTESSPSRIDNHVYVASGSGKVYGYNLKTDSLDWVYTIGSDIDGSAVVTDDDGLLISIEKQYIEGQGGALKLKPGRKNGNVVDWYFPVEDKKFASWEGGIIGSIGTNDATRFPGWPSLAAFAAIDGNLYIVDHKNLDYISSSLPKMVIGFDGQKVYPTPKLIFKAAIGPSISTPIFVKDKLIVAGYHGIYLYKYDQKGNFKLLDKFEASFESTPIAVDGKIYIASRNGYLYCFGD